MLTVEVDNQPSVFSLKGVVYTWEYWNKDHQSRGWVGSVRACGRWFPKTQFDWLYIGQSSDRYPHHNVEEIDFSKLID